MLQLKRQRLHQVKSDSPSLVFTRFSSALRGGLDNPTAQRYFLQAATGARHALQFDASAGNKVYSYPTAFGLDTSCGPPCAATCKGVACLGSPDTHHATPCVSYSHCLRENCEAKPDFFSACRPAKNWRGNFSHGPESG